MRIADLVVKERPRERLAMYGVGALSDEELLAVLLGNGTKNESAKELGGKILKRFHLSELNNASPKELCTVHGIGTAKACRLLAAFEVARRLQREAAPVQIKDSQNAFSYCQPIIGHLEQEHFLVVFLDVKNRVKGHQIITKGLVDSSLIHPREVFREAIRNNAHAIIVSHNHPTGDITPSAEDEEVTRVLRKTGELLGIQLLDHVIVGKHES